MDKITALVACEESQTTTKNLRALGVDAFSCDVQPCSGGHPEWHIKGDAMDLVNGKCSFVTMDGTEHKIEKKWDLLIAHPPCTFLSSVTTRHLSLRMNTPDKVVERMWNVAAAAVFFMRCMLADCEHIAVENPAGFMSRLYRRPDQIVHPYYFATSEADKANYQKKRTCFWLKGLKPLERKNFLPPPKPYGYTKKGQPINFEEAHGRIPGLERDMNSSRARSKTFGGISEAMARQWSREVMEARK